MVRVLKGVNILQPDFLGVETARKIACTTIPKKLLSAVEKEFQLSRIDIERSFG